LFTAHVLPQRSMSSAAQKPVEPAAEVKAQLFPLHRKGDNLFDLLGMCDYYGVGYKAARKDWIDRYPESYWIVTKVKMTATSRRAWGKLVWKGQPQNDGAAQQVCVYRYMDVISAHILVANGTNLLALALSFVLVSC